MSIWWVLLAAWVVLQIPFAMASRKWKPLLSRYPMGVTCRLAIPFSKGWESQIEVDDLTEMRKYRRFILLYFWGVFAIPIQALFLAMALVGKFSAPDFPMP